MVIANIFGILVFLFLLWKTLKEDYQYEKIFNLGLTAIFAYLLSLILLKFVYSQFWFWIIVFAISLSIFFVSKRQKMKFFEVFDAISVSFLPWVALFFIEDSIVKSSLSSFLAFWITLISIFFYYLLKSYYRSFSWYKSGRVGFAGIVTLFLLFVVRFVTSFFNLSILTYAGKYEMYLSGSSTLLLGLLLYNLFKYNGK